MVLSDPTPDGYLTRRCTQPHRDRSHIRSPTFPCEHVPPKPAPNNRRSCKVRFGTVQVRRRSPIHLASVCDRRHSKPPWNWWLSNCKCLHVTLTLTFSHLCRPAVVSFNVNQFWRHCLPTTRPQVSWNCHENRLHVSFFTLYALDLRPLFPSV